MTTPDYPKALAALRWALDLQAKVGKADRIARFAGHARVTKRARDLLASLDAARGEAVVHLGRYFCDGPEGHFWCDSLTHARKFVDAVDADHEWTITTVAPPADDALADTQRAIIEAAERRGYERALADLRAYGPEAMLAAANKGNNND